MRWGPLLKQGLATRGGSRAKRKHSTSKTVIAPMFGPFSQGNLNWILELLTHEERLVGILHWQLASPQNPFSLAFVGKSISVAPNKCGTFKKAHRSPHCGGHPWQSGSRSEALSSLGEEGCGTSPTGIERSRFLPSTDKKMPTDEGGHFYKTE